MCRLLAICSLALILVATPLAAAPITGQYVEARTCDVWTGPCFANAEFNLTGKNAVMAWKIKEGTFRKVALDGMSVVAVICASDTLGLKQTGPSKAIFIVDEKASPAQRKALIAFAQKQSGALLRNVISVRTSPIDLKICDCKGQTCAELQAGTAKIKTRCIDHHHDKACGNECAFYPTLASGVRAKAAVALEHTFNGPGLGHTWSDYGRRGAYVGSFSVRN